MKNWIDIITADEYFDLIDINKNYVIHTNLRFGSNTIHTHYEQMVVIRDVPKNFHDEPPTLAFFTPLYKTTDGNGLPHGVKPAAAQRYGVVAFLWGTFSDVGKELAAVADIITTPLGDDGFIPHREDGFPAIIEMVNLYKHYYHGLLHRVGNHPTIKTDYVVSSWFLNGVQKRIDGPCGITIKNYQEFWKDGVNHGYKEEDHYLDWALRDSSIGEITTGTLVTPRIDQNKLNPHVADLSDFLSSLHGETNIFSNTYFTDAQDEICFGAEFL